MNKVTYKLNSYLSDSECHLVKRQVTQELKTHIHAEYSVKLRVHNEKILEIKFLDNISIQEAFQTGVVVGNAEKSAILRDDITYHDSKPIHSQPVEF